MKKSPAMTICTALLALAGACHAGAPHSGLDPASMDASVRVQDNLFLAANGSWIAGTPIPPNKTYVLGVEINDTTDARIRAIVERLATTGHQPGTIEHQVGAFYASYVDTGAIDKAGLAPLRRQLAVIDAIGSASALAAWQGKVQGLVETPVWLRVFPDLKDPTVNRVMTWQGGLGLPDRDYYLQPGDARMATALAAYRDYLAALARLAGMADPAGAADRVIRLETRLAEVHLARADSVDVSRMYNPATPAALAASAPGFDWSGFLAGAGLKQVQSLTVTQLATVTASAALMGQLPLEDWKLYYKLRLINAQAPVLPAAFRAAHFAFHGKALRGATVAEPRWQQGIAALNGAMGEAVGQLYVRHHFSAQHKRRVQAIATEVLAAYRDSISELDWMSAATRTEALDKLSRYGSKIGYPDKWRDYGALQVRRGDALGNRSAAARFNWLAQAARADRAVDRSAWQFTPQTVDAMYDPMLNEIVFPAASLQPPFFDIDADDAANFGAIGANIGHEISHGFDAQGSQFDGKGVLRNWWSAADRAAFEALGARLASQFDAYEPLPGKRVNGKYTLTENMADLSGLQVAFKAYQRSLGGKPSPVIDGLSGEQRFFLAAAQFRRVKMRDDAMATMLASDPHAPHEYRANGPAINTDGFHAAFGTREGDAMYRPAAERIRIW